MNEPARASAALAALLAASLPGAALATQETDISPMLQGDVELSFSGTVFSAALREQGIDVGAVSRTAQTAALNVHFGVAPGVETYLVLPTQVGGSWSYSNVSPMDLCPGGTQPESCTSGTAYGTALIYAGKDATGTPVFLGADPLDDALVPVYNIDGGQDLALGVRFAPLSERWLGRGEARSGRLNSRATWTGDVALLVPLGGNFFELDGNGDRGAASGKVGLRFRTAMSTRMKLSAPYVSFEYKLNRPYSVYLDPTDVAAPASEIDPPDDVRFFTGTELIPYEDRSSGNRFGVDLGLGYHLRTQGTFASGYLLPSVLTEEQVLDAGLDPDEVITQGEAVGLDEQLGMLGRVRLRFDAVGHVKVHLGVALGYYLPSRVEHDYNIKYGRAIGAEYEIGIAGMW